MSVFNLPITNVVRAYLIDPSPNANMIDYNIQYPTVDKMRIGTTYQTNVNSVSSYPDFPVNKTMYLQLQANLPNTGLLSVRLQQPDSTTVNPTITNITPTGFTSALVVKISVSFTQLGLHRLIITDAIAGQEIVYTDYFNVVNENLDSLVQVNFSDSKNLYDTIFYNSGGTLLYSPTAYYKGRILPSAPENEDIVFEDEIGVKRKTRTKVRRSQVLTITDVHFGYIDVFSHQMACDSVTVNGIEYTADVPEVDFINNTDLVNISVKLTEIRENNFINL